MLESTFYNQRLHLNPVWKYEEKTHYSPIPCVKFAFSQTFCTRHIDIDSPHDNSRGHGAAAAARDPVTFGLPRRSVVSAARTRIASSSRFKTYHFLRLILLYRYKIISWTDGGRRTCSALCFVPLACTTSYSPSPIIVYILSRSSLEIQGEHVFSADFLCLAFRHYSPNFSPATGPAGNCTRRRENPLRRRHRRSSRVSAATPRGVTFLSRRL